LEKTIEDSGQDSLWAVHGANPVSLFRRRRGFGGKTTSESLDFDKYLQFVISGIYAIERWQGLLRPKTIWLECYFR
jgi:hypothetical protein